MFTAHFTTHVSGKGKHSIYFFFVFQFFFLSLGIFILRNCGKMHEAKKNTSKEVQTKRQTCLACFYSTLLTLHTVVLTIICFMGLKRERTVFTYGSRFLLKIFLISAWFNAVTFSPGFRWSAIFLLSIVINFCAPCKLMIDKTNSLKPISAMHIRF